jgi:hypothetical protein
MPVVPFTPTWPLLNLVAIFTESIGCRCLMVITGSGCTLQDRYLAIWAVDVSIWIFGLRAKVNDFCGFAKKNLKGLGIALLWGICR